MTKKGLILGLIGILIIHIFILKSITFTAWPEMFSYPYLLDNDFRIYKDFAHPYVPLLTFILTFYYKFAGMNLVSHQYFTWGLIIINDLLIFLISNKLLKKKIALVPLVLYVFLQPIFEGNMLWFDLATTPFILGFFSSLIYIKNLNRRLFWSGFLLAMALLIKQQSVVLLTLVFLLIVLIEETRKSVHFFLAGIVIPLFFTFSVLAICQILNNFLFWVLEFPIIWLPKFPGYVQLPATREIFFLIFLFGFPAGFLLIRFKNISILAKHLLIAIIASVGMAFPRFSYFHLQPALVVIIVFYIFVLADFKKIAPLFLIAPILIGAYLWKDYKPFIGVENSRFYDNEELELADFIKQNTTYKDKVYFLGPHSLLFSLSGRLPPHPWIENYVWHFEIPGMQESQIQGFEREENLVIFRQPPGIGNWYDLGVYQPDKIIKYVDRKFELVNKNESGLQVWKRKKSK